jgi:hypothetical protein
VLTEARQPETDPSAAASRIDLEDRIDLEVGGEAVAPLSGGAQATGYRGVYRGWQVVLHDQHLQRGL